MPEPPKSQMEFDPNRSPFTDPAARFSYLELPDKTKLKINTENNVVVPMKDQPYPGVPVKLPKELMAVGQPFIRKCGKPKMASRTWAGWPEVEDMGCDAALGGGCPILLHYGAVGPVNVIAEKDGKEDSFPCHKVYCGVSPSGRPTSQAHMLQDGYRILTDRTAIRENIVNFQTKQLETRYTEVPDLAPFYEEAKAGRFAPKAPPEKKKIGRPRKDANRESVPAA